MDFLEEVRSAAHSDKQYKSGLRSLSANPSDSDHIKPSKHLTMENGDILQYRGRLYIPKLMINTTLESEHDSKVTGHFRKDKTIELVSRNFWWPGMDSDIEGYIQACPDCQRDKPRRHRKYGLLSPLEHPYAPLQSIAMDFITDLPQSKNCTELLVVNDRFSKMASFIPLEQDKKNVEDIARILAREIWRLHGLPRDIVSDCNSRFTFHTWKDFLSVTGIRPQMSTAFHPQSDGETERVNQVIEACLRPYINQE